MSKRLHKTYQGVPKLGTREFLKSGTTIPDDETTELSSSIDDTVVPNEGTTELPSSVGELFALREKRGVLEVNILRLTEEY